MEPKSCCMLDTSSTHQLHAKILHSVLNRFLKWCRKKYLQYTVCLVEHKEEMTYELTLFELIVFIKSIIQGLNPKTLLVQNLPYSLYLWHNILSTLRFSAFQFYFRPVFSYLSLIFLFTEYRSWVLKQQPWQVLHQADFWRKQAEIIDTSLLR